jgi:hypothetical protein
MPVPYNARPKLTLSSKFPILREPEGEAMITATCPCGKRLDARDDMAGGKARCPGCGTMIDVPPAVAPDREAEPGPKEDASAHARTIPAEWGHLRAEPARGLIIVDLAGRRRPYLVTGAEARMLRELSEAWPGWISGAQMRRRDPKIYNPAVVLARLRGRGLPGFRVESDPEGRMRLAID